MRLNVAWRLMSIIVLLVYALLMFGVVLLLAHSLIFAIMLGATATLMVYAVWLLFTKAGRASSTGWWLTSGATAGLVAELFYFLSNTRNRRALLAATILTVIYLALFSLLRQKYWAEMRRSGELSGNTAHFQTPYLIINPKSGNGRAIKAHISELAQQQGIHVIMTEKDRTVEDTVQEAVNAGADVLGISGGDGSIGAVARVAIKRNLPMVVLPGGTRCHFARDLGLDPKRIVDSLAGFTGVERRIDAGEINGRIFLNNASFGLYADIVDQPEYRQHKMQVSRQVLGAMAQGSKDLYDLQFNYNDLSAHKAVQVLVGVNRYEMLNIFELGHRQRLDEGVLSVAAVTMLDNRIARQLLKAVSIHQLSKPGSVRGFHQWVDRKFVVNSTLSKLVVGVDGERESYTTPVNIHILPRVLRIYVPAEGERNRQKNPFSGSVLRHLWRAAAYNKV
jgi:diacylglycerol kinase family enzyme